MCHSSEFGALMTTTTFRSTHVDRHYYYIARFVWMCVCVQLLHTHTHTLASIASRSSASKRATYNYYYIEASIHWRARTHTPREPSGGGEVLYSHAMSIFHCIRIRTAQHGWHSVCWVFACVHVFRHVLMYAPEERSNNKNTPVQRIEIYTVEKSSFIR